VYCTVMKHDEHLKTRRECRHKQEPQTALKIGKKKRSELFTRDSQFKTLACSIQFIRHYYETLEPGMDLKAN